MRGIAGNTHWTNKLIGPSADRVTGIVVPPLIAIRNGSASTEMYSVPYNATSNGTTIMATRIESIKNATNLAQNPTYTTSAVCMVAPSSAGATGCCIAGGLARHFNTASRFAPGAGDLPIPRANIVRASIRGATSSAYFRQIGRAHV